MKLPGPTSNAPNEELPDSPIASVGRALPAGTWLDEFELGETIGEGSAAIVYLATDRGRAVPVTIAEYMPAKLAQRNHAQVTPRISGQADAFARGLKAFINETRTLARCNHPSLLRIVRLWEANGTVYRVMPRYPARRLLDVRLGMNEPPDEEAVRALLDPLLGALGVFHQAGGGHGKVTPSNILLLDDNRPLLLGPGAAGRAIAGDRIDVLMTSAEPCFAPIEQMVESVDIPLRPSVDLYALAGVARYWISGQLPAPPFGGTDSPRREKLADSVQRLRMTWPQLHYSAALLDALDSALSIYPAERPQSVAQMRARLGTAPAAVDGPASAALQAAPALDNAVPSSPVPVRATQPALNDAVSASPAPGPASTLSEAVPASPSPASAPASAPAPAPNHASPDRVTQDLDVVMSFAADPDPQATSGLVRVDDDRLVRRAFARQTSKPRRIARWSGAVLVLLALLVIGVFEFGQEGQFAQVLDALGISRDAGIQNNAAVSAPAASPAPPVPPSIGTDIASVNPVPTERPAANSVSGAMAPSFTASAPIAADGGIAKPAPTEPTASDSSPGATAPASAANASRTTPSTAATAAPAEPAAVAQSSAALPPTTRSAQQHAAHAPASPREACGPRTQFSLYRCMKTQCSQRQWASHAQCARLRATDSVD